MRAKDAVFLTIFFLSTLFAGVVGQDQIEQIYTIDVNAGSVNNKYISILAFRTNSYVWTLTGWPEENLRNFKAYDAEGNQFRVITSYDKSAQSMRVEIHFGTTKPEGFRFTTEHDLINQYRSGQDLYTLSRTWSAGSGSQGYALAISVRLPRDFVIVSVVVSPGSQYTSQNEGGVPLVKINGFVTPNQPVSFTIRFQESQRTTTTAIQMPRTTTQSVATSSQEANMTTPVELGQVGLPKDLTALAALALVVALAGAVFLFHRRAKRVTPPKPRSTMTSDTSHYEEYARKLEELRRRGQISEATYRVLREEFESKKKSGDSSPQRT